MIPIQKGKAVRIPAAFLIKEIFSTIGFLFILLFTVRGIWQIAYTAANKAANIGAVLAGKEISRHGSAILSALKQPHCPVLDTVLLIFCVLIMIHGVIGVFYAVKTDYRFKGLFKQKASFYLQIFSAIGTFFVIYLFTGPSGSTGAHSIFSWAAAVLLSFLGAFHLANGFSNACVTLEISVSKRSKTVATALSWLIGIISMLQIAVILL